jgi:hypothetical protein
MIKRILHIVFYCTVLFCVISFLSLVISIITNKINHSFPNFKIGFPFNYYYQIQIKNGNCFEIQHGTTKTNIIYNLILCVFAIILFLKIKKQNN